jgi:hypothetical protein
VGASAAVVTVHISAESARSASLQLSWDDGTTAAAETLRAGEGADIGFRIAADGGSVSLTLAPGGKTIRLTAGSGENRRLVVRIGNPPDSKAALVIEAVMAQAADK